MKKKFLKNLLMIKNKFIEYVIYNKLFITFIVVSIIGFGLCRYYTIGEFFSLRSFFVDFAIILIIGAFSYFVKSKNKFKYFMTFLIIFTIIDIINVIYYKFYTSFASLGDLGTLGQAETVTESLFARIWLSDFIFLLAPIIFYYVHKKISATNYYYNISKISFQKKIQ